MAKDGGKRNGDHRTAGGDSKEKWDDEVVFEFGGSVGVVSLMLLFPTLMLYFCACLLFNQGAMILPRSADQVAGLLRELAPTPYAFQLYLGFCVLQLILAAVMPGPVVYGMPVPSEGNKPLAYLVSDGASPPPSHSSSAMG